MVVEKEELTTYLEIISPFLQLCPGVVSSTTIFTIIATYHDHTHETCHDHIHVTCHDHTQCVSHMPLSSKKEFEILKPSGFATKTSVKMVDHQQIMLWLCFPLIG